MNKYNPLRNTRQYHDLLLKHADPNIGFNEWKNLSNPDIYVLKYFNPDHLEIERMWHKI